MRNVGVVAGTFAVAVLGLVPLGTAQEGYHFFTIPWRADGPFQWANLTWSGTGGIDWAGAPSEDNQPPDPQTAAQYDTQNDVKAYTGVDTGPGPRKFTFESKPVPRTLILNESRPIQLELFLKVEDGSRMCMYYPTEPPMEVRLTMNGRILGGTNAMTYLYQYVQWYYMGPPYTPPADPAGYTTCRLAFGAEAAVIPEGATLKLEVTFLSQQRTYSFGLAGDHRSNLRFSLYPPEEILFRHPELAPSEESLETAPEGSAPSAGAIDVQPAAGLLTGLALVAGLALAPGAPSRKIALALALLFAAAVFSGCVGSKGSGTAKGSDQTLQGNVANTHVRSDLASGNLGGIVGQVHDDLHVPVGGVHVSIIGMTEFTQTDGKGRFTFLNLVPGIVKIRFDKKDYRSFEAELEVKAGFVSRPDITLFLTNPKERDARPHSHDYWPAGAAAKPIMDAELGRTCLSQNDCYVNNGFSIPGKVDEFTTIMPGTSEVEVKLEWDPDLLGQEELGLAIQHNGDRYYNYSIYAPRGPGVPFHIATNWEMSDPGHQLFSTWNLRWYEDRPDYNGYLVCVLICVREPDAGKVLGEAQPWVKAKITIHKGLSLPLEPGHPDHWAGKTELQVFKGVATSFGHSGSAPPSSPVCVYYYECYRFYAYPLRPKLIPDGTTSVEVHLKLSRPLNPQYNLILYYKPANQPANKDYYSVQSWKVVQPQSGGTWEKTVYKIQVKPSETDFMYAKATGWQFALRPDNYDAEWQDYTMNNPSMCLVLYCVQNPTPGAKYLTFTFDAWARK